MLATIAATTGTGTMRAKRASIEHLRGVTRYEQLRKTILEVRGSGDLEKPLAHWVLPADRRLPLALLDRCLGDLLETDFDELAATPGVGQTKLRSFLNLLTRVADSRSEENGNGKKATAPSLAPGRFDPSCVSDAQWTQWQDTVRRCGLAREPLGLVAPTLKNVTRVIWHTPLADYLDVSLGELREKRTFGEKRVHAVLKVFHGLHCLAGQLAHHDELSIRLVPRHVDRVERWIGQRLQRAALPQATEITEGYIAPLVDQLRQDASSQIIELAETRLGLAGPPASVRQAAGRMGLTRARVYQLLNEINDILTVRWPLGRCQSYHLMERVEEEMSGDRSLDQFRTAVELFYPAARRGAAGAVERAAGSL